MPYAEVCVNIPSRERKTYSYSIPKDIHLSVGDMVWVPFGAQTLQGIVFDITDDVEVEETKDITGVIDTPAGLLLHQISLAQWISDYYLCPLFEAASLMLAPGAERNSSILLVPSVFADDAPIEKLSTLQRSIFDFILAKGVASLEDVRKAVGKRSLSSVITYLVRKGLIERRFNLKPPSIRPQTARFVRYSEGVLYNQKRLGEKKKAVLAFLYQVKEAETFRESGNFVPEELVKAETGTTSAIISSLYKQKLIDLEIRETLRDPLKRIEQAVTRPVVLTKSQENAWEQIRSSLRRSCITPPKVDTGLQDILPNPDKIFLLHGVTGSGKTEIYLKALEEVVSQGKQGIVLVPEISLTPQTIQRFRSHFPGRIALLHSKLSPGERFDEWRRIRKGEVDVIVGVRSAVFAPASRLGIIIIDEEHEWSYKSDFAEMDLSADYHAKDVSLKLSALTNAIVILGSATPSFESYYRAKAGQYTYLRLPERVSGLSSSVGSAETQSPVVLELPSVEIVDLRHELKEGNTSIFSRSLHDAMLQTLSLGKQVILFLNHRGTSSVVMCRDCGNVIRCNSCDISLTYHQVEDRLICHLCGRRVRVPRVCPQCQSKRIRYLGIGTQKVEEETAKVFPSARLLRLDGDVTRDRHAHEKILASFMSHGADILIGTQMIAKGFNLPLVTLVGVINADIGLYLPDFRAGERTFQLLTQVAGRAGRDMSDGKVIIQTYTPEHYAIRAASQHDYQSFYNNEVRYRRERSNPPFGELVNLVYSHLNEARCRKEAERIGHLLRQEIHSHGMGDVSVLGPAPAFVGQLRGRHRWQLILRGKDLHQLLEKLTFPLGWKVDVDPVSLL